MSSNNSSSGNGANNGNGNGNGKEVAQIRNDNGKLVGYRCDDVVRDNTVTEVPLIFYIDLASPVGQQQAAIDHMSEALVEDVSSKYGISNGLRCSDPPLDGTSWLVQFTVKPGDFKRVDLFDQCREYNFDAAVQDCFVYEALVTGSALGVQEIPDVMAYVETTLRGNSLIENTPFGVGFLGVPIVDPGTSDAGRDNLGQPSNIYTQVQPTEPDDKRSITIIGGLLVAAFCVAFIGIGIVLWRRRKAYMKHNREMHLSLSKSSDLQQYDTEPHVTISDEEADSAKQPPELSSPTPTEENFPNNITFDLGTSFKDQLMGVHAGGGGGGPRRHPHMSGPFGSAPSADGTESDADSWAQTDGTIGSLELQLEPITAEV